MKKNKLNKTKKINSIRRVTNLFVFADISLCIDHMGWGGLEPPENNVSGVAIAMGL
jgi:hypothetical protein